MRISSRNLLLFLRQRAMGQYGISPAKSPKQTHLKITILTQYFPPEVGAPQNRLFELAVRLKKQGHEITILTAMPNYPSMKIHKAYKGKWFLEEEMEGMRVLRSAIFVSESKSIILRLLNYFSFVFTALFYGIVKLKKHDFLLVESPPLFLGITGYLLSRFKRAKLLFNVSDLWPESAEKLGIITNKTLLKLATYLEEFLYRKSALITGQTQGIVQDIQKRFPSKQVHWLPNGVDLTYFKSGTVSPEKDRFGLNDNDMVFSYAGIIGHAQGLELILHVAEQLKDSHPRIKFCFLGSGPVKEELIQLKEKLELTNVLFLDLIPKSDMPVYIASTDVALIPLRKLDLFKGAIPSKIFENCAMEKPLLLGVDGEARELFIDQGHAGLYYEPENVESMKEQVLHFWENPHLLIDLGKNGRNYVSKQFDRNIIAKEFEEVLNEHLTK